MAGFWCYYPWRPGGRGLGLPHGHLLSTAFHLGWRPGWVHRGLVFHRPADAGGTGLFPALLCGSLTGTGPYPDPDRHPLLRGVRWPDHLDRDVRPRDPPGSLFRNGRLSGSRREDSSPPLLGFFYCGMLATVMSSVDSFLFVGGNTVGRDLAWRLSGGRADQVRWSRWGLLIATLLSTLIGLASSSVVDLWVRIRDRGHGDDAFAASRSFLSRAAATKPVSSSGACCFPAA